MREQRTEPTSRLRAIVEAVRTWLRKLLTLNGTPRGIAGGFALGLTLSLIPIPALGMLVALALAPLLRLNPPATYLGTAVVNPLTGPFIYFGELSIGLFALGRPLPSWEVVRVLDASGWLALFLDALFPFAIGAMVLCTASLVVTFPAVWWMVARYRTRTIETPEG